MESVESGGGQPGQQQQQQSQAQQQPMYVFVQPVSTSDADHFQKTYPARLVNALSAGQIFLFSVTLISEVRI